MWFRVWGGGGGVQRGAWGGGVGPDPEFPLLFHDNYIPHPKRLSSAPRVFLSQPFLVHDFGESRIPTSIQTPCPVKTLYFFPNPALYFSQIPHPENTLPGKSPGDQRFDVVAVKSLEQRTTKLYQRQSTILQMFYLTRETDTINYCKIATSKQKKTMELVHNSA